MKATILVPNEVLEAYPDTGLGKLLVAHGNDLWVNIHLDYRAGHVMYNLDGDKKAVDPIVSHLRKLMVKYNAEHRGRPSSDTKTISNHIY